jgi:hypothetical protein
LGYSRRCYVGVFVHERQSAVAAAPGRHVPPLRQRADELLLDNARALVDDHNRQTPEVKFSDRFHAFCRYWA